MAFGYNRTSGSTSQTVGDLVAGSDPQRDTKIDFENDQIDFVAGGSSILKITTSQVSSSTDIVAGQTLVSNYSSGDEGGEIKLNKPQTNTNITGSVTIDVYQNKLRIFETGGSNRGGFFDISTLDVGVGRDLASGGVAGSGDITSVSAGSGLTGGGTSGAVTLSLSSSITVTSISASTYIGLPSSTSLTVSGTSAEGATYNNTVSKITFDNNTGFQVSQSAPNEVFLSIGSHYKDIVVAGQTTLSATGSDSLELKGLGGVAITTSLVDSNANGILKEVTFSTTELSSSLNTRISTLESGKFPSSSLSIPYYDNSVAPSVIAPPSSGNREGKVLAWLNDGTIGWKAIVLAASVLNTRYMEAEASAGPLISPIYLSITTGAIG